MRKMRCHRGDAAEISTLPRTSDGQNGAVAVRGSLNNGLPGAYRMLRRLKLTP